MLWKLLTEGSVLCLPWGPFSPVPGKTGEQLADQTCTLLPVCVQKEHSGICRVCKQKPLWGNVAASL